VPPVLSGSAVRGGCRPSLVDLTGTGLASYVILHPLSNGANANMGWTVQENDGTGSGAVQTFTFGQKSDVFIDGDFDGDGIRDAAFFHPSTATWNVRRSSRPGDVVQTQVFGLGTDDPTQVGDYDGDGISDFAVYRDGASSNDASHTLILLSRTGTVRDLVT